MVHAAVGLSEVVSGEVAGGVALFCTAQLPVDRDKVRKGVERIRMKRDEASSKWQWLCYVIYILSYVLHILVLCCSSALIQNPGAQMALDFFPQRSQQVIMDSVADAAKRKRTNTNA